MLHWHGTGRAADKNKVEQVEDKKSHLDANGWQTVFKFGPIKRERHAGPEDDNNKVGGARAATVLALERGSETFGIPRLSNVRQ